MLIASLGMQWSMILESLARKAWDIVGWDRIGAFGDDLKEVSRRREQSRLQTHFTCFWSVPKYMYIPHVQDFFGCHVNVGVLGIFGFV